MRSARALVLAAITAAACHPRAGGGGGAPTSPYVATYPALRWVPADATYVVTARRAADALAAVRTLTQVLGILYDFDVDEAGDEMRRALGFDPLNPQAVADTGVDLDGGVAVFSRGLSPTFAIAVADPARLAAAIDQARTGGVAVQVERQDGVDLYTYRGDRDLRLHWAVADRWLFVHLEIRDEKEADLDWWKSLRAAGGAWAGGPDLAAAIARAGATPPPVIGAARVPALVAASGRLGASATCLAALAPAGRVTFAAAVDGKDARADLAVDLAGVDPGAAVLPEPAGWEAARNGAPVQLEVGVDLDRVAAALAPCDPDARDHFGGKLGIRAGRLFATAVDIDHMKGLGAAWLAVRDPNVYGDALGEIPGLSLASHERTVGGAKVVDVSLPMVPSFSYSLAGPTAVVAVGDGLIDRVLGAGAPVATASLAHVEVHPHVPGIEWDGILADLLDVRADARPRTLRRIRAWEVGTLDAAWAGGALTLSVRGHVH